MRIEQQLLTLALAIIAVTIITMVTAYSVMEAPMYWLAVALVVAAVFRLVWRNYKQGQYRIR